MSCSLFPSSSSLSSSSFAAAVLARIRSSVRVRMCVCVWMGCAKEAPALGKNWLGGKEKQDAHTVCTRAVVSTVSVVPGSIGPSYDSNEAPFTFKDGLV